jgi:hypothetical protein
VTLASETQLDAIVDQAFGSHPVANPHFGQQVASALLEHAGSNPLLDILPAAVLDHNGIDSLQI